MQLLDINDDMLLALIECLPDLTLATLSLTCRRLLSLASPSLKRRKDMIEYRCIELATSQHHTARWKHPIEVLFDIRRTSSIVEYIGEIRYAPPLPRIGSEKRWSDPTDEHKAMLEECNYLESELQQLTFLTESERRIWKEGLRECDNNACFMVLLSLCTKATILSLNEMHDLSIYLHAVVRYLIDEHEYSLTNAGEQSNHRSTKQLFPRLTTLKLYNSDSNHGMSLNEDFILLEIPTLKDLYFHNIGPEECEDEWVWRTKFDRSCSVERVILSKCSFKPQALTSFIRGIPQLTHLEYDNYYGFCQSIHGGIWCAHYEFTDLFWHNAKLLLRERSLQITDDVSGNRIRLVKLSNSELVQKPYWAEDTSDESEQID